MHGSTYIHESFFRLDRHFSEWDCSGIPLAASRSICDGDGLVLAFLGKMGTNDCLSRIVLDLEDALMAIRAGLGEETTKLRINNAR